MQSSLSWIEWLDRLDRVLKATREDVRALAGLDGPRSMAVIARCTRQLAALTNELRMLDRSVLSTHETDGAALDRASNLQKALDTTLVHLGAMAQVPQRESRAMRERITCAVDAALRDTRYEAVMLVQPPRVRPEARAC